MKKKILALLLTSTCVVSMVACGSTESATDNTEQKTDEEVEIANPWHDCTADEAYEVAPNLFSAPNGATNEAWSMMDATSEGDLPMVQLTFDYEGMTFTAREQVVGDEATDISGLYYEWTAEEDVTLANWGQGNMAGTVYRYIGDEESVDLCTWYDIEIGAMYSLSTSAADLDGFDIQAIAEAMYDETKQVWYNMPDDTGLHEPMDITGCDTFTQIVDKLEDGQGYANVTINGVDVLLVASSVYDNSDDASGKYAAIDAEIYYYNDGTPTYLDYVECGGTAYPLAVADGILYTAGNHFVKCYTIEGSLFAIDKEAWVEYDGNGDGTYYCHSDLRDLGGDDEGKLKDDTYLNSLFNELASAEFIEFTKVE